MKERAFWQVDVFTSRPYFGNPLAVVLEAEGLSDEEMQRFARWTNLSETTFVLPPTQPGADYRVRIFTPGGELPFAGHPTLGSCHCWLAAQGAAAAGKQRIVQECKQGLVQLRKDGNRLAFAAPPMRRSSPAPALLAKVAGALGLKSAQILSAQLLDNGPQWLSLLLDDPQTVLRLEPDHLALKNLGQKVGVVAMYTSPGGRGAVPARKGEKGTAAADQVADMEVRAFAAPIGVQEDPVTGSLNASLAQWLIAEGHAPPSYIAAQGTCLGRAGQVHISSEAGQVWVGGQTVTCVAGTVLL